jgi:hypothetical protein
MNELFHIISLFLNKKINDLNDITIKEEKELQSNEEVLEDLF